MEALMGWLCIAFVLLCVVSAIWRINMILNHPEKYERLRKAEREHQERQMEVAGRAAKTVGKGAVLLLIKLLSKR